MIAKGKHKATAYSWELGATPNTGTRFIRVIFETSETHDFVPWDGWFTEKTIERTMDSLENTGWDGASLADPVGIGSKECMIDVEHEEHEGRTYAKVKWVNRIGGGGLKEENKLTARERAGLDQEFAASLMERRQKNGSSPAPATRAPAQRRDTEPAYGSPDDEDLPF